jgi:hypothetical protein
MHHVWLVAKAMTVNESMVRLLPGNELVMPDPCNFGSLRYQSVLFVVVLSVRILHICQPRHFFEYPTKVSWLTQ